MRKPFRHLKPPERSAEPIFRSTSRIAESMNATGMRSNKAAAITGGTIARNARQELEQRTGKPVVTPENLLPPKSRKALKAPKPVSKAEDDESS